MGATPQQGSIASESQATRTPGCNERDRLPVEDHLAPCQAGLAGGESAGERRVFAVWRADRLRCSESPAGVAQQAEQPSCKRQVSGSNPLTGSQVSRDMILFDAGHVDRSVDRMTLIRLILSLS